MTKFYIKCEYELKKVCAPHTHTPVVVWKSKKKKNTHSPGLDNLKINIWKILEKLYNFFLISFLGINMTTSLLLLII